MSKKITSDNVAAADSAAELAGAADSCICQTAEDSVSNENREIGCEKKKGLFADFIAKLRKTAQKADEQLEYFRQSVSEMLDSLCGAASAVKKSAGRIRTRVKASRRANERFRTDGWWMQRRLLRKEKTLEKIRQSQFAEAAETLAAVERRSIMRFDRIREKGRRITKKCEYCLDSIIQYITNHRKRCTAGAAAVMAFMIVFSVTINAATVYDYSYRGTQLGTVKNKTEIVKAAEQVPESVDTQVNITVDPESDVTYTKQLKFSADTDTAEIAADKIANSDNLTGEGFAIIVDGRTAALVDSRETAEKILEKVKLYYCTPDDEDEKEGDSVSADKTEKNDKTDKADKTEKNDKTDKTAKADKTAVTDKTEEEPVYRMITFTEEDFSADQEKVEALRTIIMMASALAEEAEEKELKADSEEEAIEETAENETEATGTVEKAVATKNDAVVIGSLQKPDQSAMKAVMTAVSATAEQLQTAEEIAETSQNNTVLETGAQDGGVSEAESILTAAQIIDEAAAVLTADSELDSAENPLVFSAVITPDDIRFDEEVKIEPITANIDVFMDYETASDIFIDEKGASKLLTVATDEIHIFTENIAYETVYEEDDTLYEGETEVKTKGEKGKERITARVYRVNGQEVRRDILSEVEIQAPVNEVILKGTKERPVSDATGEFMMPAKGKITSQFGARWGRQHKGIDIAASYGTPIVAADSGTVIYSGYNNGGYGYMIKIDHGNGYVTIYAHNSSNCVTTGMKVTKGQLIGNVGSTGRSTGNHCHFEVRINDTPVDPMSYLN